MLQQLELTVGLCREFTRCLGCAGSHQQVPLQATLWVWRLRPRSETATTWQVGAASRSRCCAQQGPWLRWDAHLSPVAVTHCFPQPPHP